MKRSIGLIGEPGVGKTTVMRNVLDQLDLVPDRLGAAKWMLCREERLIVMGIYGEGVFDGTDRLSMSCYADLEESLVCFSTLYPDYVVLWEGDRLTRNRWVNALEEQEYSIEMFHLIADHTKTQKRRNDRGSQQNPSWIAGRITCAKRLADEHDADTIDMTDDQVAANLAKQIQGLIQIHAKT